MLKKSLPAALAAALAALTLAPAAPAAAVAEPTIEVRLGHSSTLKQSNSKFTCPANEVLIGRAHRGDENGDTTFRCGRIFIDNVQVTVLKLDFWGTVKDENEHDYRAPENRAIVGIRHDGDENGDTVYYSGALYLQSKPVQIHARQLGDWVRENNHDSMAGAGQVMTGRKHSGDENGWTQYEYGWVSYSG
ncbi:hypothetical protein ACIBCT_03940 [Streptosporangium sp. NPDC050855]|uniref:hypothetical protein n=1 Tax=Streptosporangium sp. NPDC050855 TaxID=3366194 RepID=UPI0037B786BC